MNERHVELSERSSVGIENIQNVQRKCQLELGIAVAYELCMGIVSISDLASLDAQQTAHSASEHRCCVRLPRECGHLRLATSGEACVGPPLPCVQVTFVSTLRVSAS